jgi:hypothetical protein
MRRPFWARRADHHAEGEAIARSMQDSAVCVCGASRDEHDFDGSGLPGMNCEYFRDAAKVKKEFSEEMNGNATR